MNDKSKSLEEMLKSDSNEIDNEIRNISDRVYSIERKLNFIIQAINKDKQNYWFFRVGETGRELYRWILDEYSAISIGFSIETDFRDKRSKDKLSKVVPSSDIDQVDNFVNNMKVGDVVLLQTRPKEEHENYIYDIVRVASDYNPLQFFAASDWEKDKKCLPTRRIDWLVKNKNVSDFGEDILDYWYRRQGTVLPIKKGQSEHDALIERIDSML